MPRDRMLRATFLVSFAGHCAFLALPAAMIVVPVDEKPRDTVVTVTIEEVLRVPQIDVMGPERKLKKEEAEETATVESEEPVDQLPRPAAEAAKATDEARLAQEKIEVIDEAAEKMLRYQDMVKRRIESARRYPARARRERVEGAATVYFTVMPDGTSRGCRVARSSGFEILDREAAATVERARPFPPFPEGAPDTPLPMTVDLVFTLR